MHDCEKCFNDSHILLPAEPDEHEMEMEMGGNVCVECAGVCATC